MTNNKNTDNAIMGRNADGVLRLRMVCGLAGYAVYVMLEEKLNEEGGSLAADYFALGFDFHADAALVKQVAEDFALFTVSDDGKTLKRKEETKETEKVPLHPLKEKENKKETERGREEEKNKADEKIKSGKDDSDASVEGKKYSDAQIDKFCSNFQKFWNETLKKTNSRLRPITIIDRMRRSRLSYLRRRFNDQQIYYFAYRAAMSPFLNARNGRLNQPADINWMLASEERIVKIIEGNL